MISVGYFTALYSTPGFGPATIARYLQEHNSQSINLTFFTDDHSLLRSNEIIIKKSKFLSKIPGYWIVRSWKFYKAFKSREKSFDIIVCSNAFEAIFFAILKVKVPVMVMINDDNYLYTRFHLKEVLKAYKWSKVLFRYAGYYLERFVAGRATKVIACSEYLRKEIILKYQIDPTRVALLYPAVDTTFFKPMGPKLRKGKCRLLFLKQDWRRGGLQLLARALAHPAMADKMELHIAGVPVSQNDIIGRMFKAEGYTGELHFYGLLQPEGVRDLMQNSDLYVLPSLQEAFGISLLEAMSMSTPVIASDAGGIPEALDGGKAGMLFPAGSSIELALLLQKGLEDEYFFAQATSHASVYVIGFSKERLFSELEKICFSITVEPASP